MSDDDFFIPTGEELDRGQVPRKQSGRRGPLQRLRDRRAARQVELDVPEAVGRRRKVREPGREDDDDLLDTGSTGRVVSSIDTSDAASQSRRDLVIPPELRDKYGLDE